MLQMQLTVPALTHLSSGGLGWISIPLPVRFTPGAGSAPERPPAARRHLAKGATLVADTRGGLAARADVEPEIALASK